MIQGPHDNVRASLDKNSSAIRSSFSPRWPIQWPMHSMKPKRSPRVWLEDSAQDHGREEVLGGIGQNGRGPKRLDGEFQRRVRRRHELRHIRTPFLRAEKCLLRTEVEDDRGVGLLCEAPEGLERVISP
jgi:hypothetical protein